MEPLGIAMIGCGTVGGGVAKLLSENRERIAVRSGRNLTLRRVVVRDSAKSRPHVPKEIISTDIQAAIHDPSIAIVAELIGGAGL